MHLKTDLAIAHRDQRTILQVLSAQKAFDFVICVIRCMFEFRAIKLHVQKQIAAAAAAAVHALYIVHFKVVLLFVVMSFEF